MGRKVSIAFIGGTGRSSTSITRKLLSKGCDVAALPFEHRILIDPDGPIQFYESLGRYREPYTIDLAIQRLLGHLNGLDSTSIVETVLDTFIKKFQVYVLVGLCRSILDGVYQKPFEIIRKLCNNLRER